MDKNNQLIKLREAYYKKARESERIEDIEFFRGKAKGIEEALCIIIDTHFSKRK